MVNTLGRCISVGEGGWFCMFCAPRHCKVKTRSGVDPELPGGIKLSTESKTKLRQYADGHWILPER